MNAGVSAKCFRRVHHPLVNSMLGLRGCAAPSPGWVSSDQQGPGSWRCWIVYPGERMTEEGRRTVFKYTEDCCEGEELTFLPCSWCPADDQRDSAA